MCNRPPATSFRLFATCAGTGYKLQAAGYREHATDDRIQVTGVAYRVQAVKPPTSSCSYRAAYKAPSYRLQVKGYSLCATGHQPHSSGFLLHAQDTGYKLQAAGHKGRLQVTQWLLQLLQAIGCR